VSIAVFTGLFGALLHVFRPADVERPRDVAMEFVRCLKLGSAPVGSDPEGPIGFAAAWELLADAEKASLPLESFLAACFIRERELGQVVACEEERGLERGRGAGRPYSFLFTFGNPHSMQATGRHRLRLVFLLVREEAGWRVRAPDWMPEDPRGVR
jgi:hypothetical protein